MFTKLTGSTIVLWLFAARVFAGEVTYECDVAPILHSKCASCHRPGEAAPFSLLTYDDARKRAQQIADVTKRRLMPPWPPKDGYGHFANARRLPDAEIKTLADWAAAGSPRGDLDQAANAPASTGNWQPGEPDLVLESPPYTLRADGGDKFRNFVVPVNFNVSRWISAIELRPTNPRVTHHARLGIDSTNESTRRDAADAEPGYAGMAWGDDPDGQLVIWAPGMQASPGLAGTAWRLQSKTNLVLHSHLQPSGKREAVQFRIGLHYADKPPTLRPIILRVGSRDIDIPAGESKHVVIDRFKLPIDIDVHSIFPHAHSLCKEVRVHAELPDGTEEPLIWIEHFDEKWHDNYRYVQPVRLPRGTTLVTETTYDNSDANIRNRHHPPVRTVYGSNVDDEMQDVYLQVTAVHPDQRAVLLEEAQAAECASKLVGYGKALEMHPDDPWNREGLSASYLALGKPQDAVRELETRIKSTRPEVHTLAMLGMAYLAARDATQAEHFERQALALDAEYPLAWFGLGKALGAQRKTIDAEAAYRRAAELAPGLVDAQLSRTAILLTQGDVAEAAATCEAALAASPEDPNALIKLAEVRAKQGREVEALQLLQEARRIAPYTHPPKVLLAVFLFQNGEPNRAKILLNEARTEEPNHPVPLFFLGQLARQSNDSTAARSFLAEAAAKPLPVNWPQSHRQRFLLLL